MFERASRLKLRFDTPKGQISVEDLWDLPLTSNTGRANLDTIAGDLYRKIKQTPDVVSFVNPSSPPADADLKLRFDIVKHVIDTRLGENTKRAEAQSISEKKQKILGIIEAKENEALSAASIDDLRKQLASL